VVVSADDAKAVPAAGDVYPNAPLKEAVLEVRFPGRFRVESERYKVQERILDRFPNLMVPVETADAGPLFKMCQLTSADGREFFRIGVNGLSYITQSYPGFAEFRKHCLSLMEPSLELFGVKTLNRTGLRYVNHIPLTKQDNAIPLQAFLQIGLNLPPTIPATYEQLVFAVETKKPPGSLRLQVAYVPAKEAETGELLLLDFDFFILGPLDARKLPEYLDVSHQHTKEVFESLITDQYRKFIRGDAR
jgi:uncharacterized protein (TIGR04255 family)